MSKMNFWENNEDDYQEKLMTELSNNGVFEKSVKRARIVCKVAKVLIAVCVILVIASFVMGIIR